MVPTKRSLIYHIQANSNKNKLFEVILDPKGFWVDGKCSCQYWLDTHRHCELSLRVLIIKFKCMEQENIYWEGYHKGWRDAMEKAMREVREIMSER
jgi:hypothetical protein